MPRYIPDSYLKTTFVELSTDVSTSSSTYSDLLTATIETTGNVLLITADASLTAVNKTGSYAVFRFLLDGNIYSGGVVDFVKNTHGCFSARKRIQVTPGSHIIKLQWANNASALTSICAATTQYQHASLLIEEAFE